MLFTRRDVATAMSQAGEAVAPQLRWSAIADRYRKLSVRLIADSVLVRA
jgi:hypothetical protein